MVEYEKALAYISISDAQKFFGLGDSVSGLEVRLDDIDLAPEVAQSIMDKASQLEELLYAEDWTQRNKPLWDAIRLEKKVYFIVLLLLVVLASFSIISTLIMIVLEKRKDISVLMTLGASSKSVANIFKYQGTVIGLIGTALGLAGGFLGCMLLKTYGFPLDERIFQMSQLPIKMEPLNFLLVGLAAFVICVLATIYPARRASKLEPSEVLRYE